MDDPPKVSQILQLFRSDIMRLVALTVILAFLLLAYHDLSHTVIELLHWISEITA